MKVIIGSARSDENGNITGGKAGDQKGGREVSTQEYYNHSKGWRVLRPKSGEKALKMAEAMKKACANNDIGYDQGQRNTLYTNIKPYGFDPSKTTKAVETDCSALVRVCCAYAGITVGDFSTSSEASALLGTGAFKEVTGIKLPSGLCNGDVLVTKTKGHTVIVISGAKNPTGSDDVMSNGDSGSAVKQLQQMLIKLGYDCGKWGADGDFGDATELAVEKFQRDHGLTADGEVGPQTMAALKAAVESDGKTTGKAVKIVNGNCYVRDQPSVAGEKLGVAREGSAYEWLGTDEETGWYNIQYSGSVDGFVSPKYAKVVG